MEKQLTKQQVSQILNSAPQNLDKKVIIQKLVEKGYSLEGFQQPQKTYTGFGDAGQDIKQIGTDIKDSFKKRTEVVQASKNDPSISPASTFARTGAQAMGALSDTLGAVTKGVIKVALPQSVETGIRETVIPTSIKAVSELTNKYQTLKENNPIIAEGVNKVLGFAPGVALGVKDIITGYNKLKETNPKQAQTIDDLLSVGQFALDVATLGEGSNLVKEGADIAISNTRRGVTKIIDDIIPPGGGSGASATSSKIANKVLPSSENIMNKVARIKPNEARQFEQMTGKTVGQYLDETKNFGSPEKIVQVETDKFIQSVKDVDQALESLPGVFKSPEINTVANELVSKAKRVSAPGANAPYLKRAIELQEKAKTIGLSMSESNELKRLYERNVKLGYNKLTNADALERATNIDSALREWQVGKANELGFTNIAEMNKQTQASRFIANKLGGKIVDNALLNNMNLTDWIMLSGGDPTAVGGLLVKKIFTAKPLQAKVAQILSKSTKVPTVKPIMGDYSLQANTATTTKNSIKNDIPKVSNTIKKKSSNTVKIVDDLASEAKKYKSAEEFVKAQGTRVYHGTNADFTHFKLSEPRDAKGNFKGAYFVDNATEAKDYGKNIKEAVVNFKKPLVGNPYEEFAKAKGINYEKEMFNIKKSNVEKWIKENGFDGIIRPKGSQYNLEGAEYIALNKNAVKTKSQLTDIWNKANKK